MKQPAVYILASKKNGTLYIGVTCDLIRRIYEHKQKLIEGFTSQYGVDRLVYYELYDDISEAIKREKQLKNWKREWKTALIEKSNAEWNELYEEILGMDSGSGPE